MGKQWPLLIIMRHSNQLSCKFVSTLINLRMNGDRHHPMVGRPYTGSEDLFTLVGNKVRRKCCRFFFFALSFWFILFHPCLCSHSLFQHVINERLCGERCSDLTVILLTYVMQSECFQHRRSDTCGTEGETPDKNVCVRLLSFSQNESNFSSN